MPQTTNFNFPSQPQIDQLMATYMSKYNVPGGSLSFRRGNTLLYEAGYGFADECQDPVTTTSLFRIASDSKAITAATIFWLIDNCKLTLNATVFAQDGVLSQFAGDGSPSDWISQITVHELLTHTSGGWPNDGDDPMFQQPQMTTDELITWALQTYPLLNAPGSTYAYSNFGYCVLGRVIQQITGMAYVDFVSSNILAPIGITDMLIGDVAPQPNEVHYFMPTGQDANAPYDFNITRMAPHGGWIASADDQARFLAALFSPLDQECSSSILSRSSLELMLSCTSASIASPSGPYACGLVYNSAGNAYHGGSLPGTTALQVHTKSGMTWGCALNIRDTSTDLASALDALMWQMAGTVPAWKVNG